MLFGRLSALGLTLAAAALLGVPGLPARAAAPVTQGDGKDGVDRYGDPLPPGAVVRLGTVRYRFGGHGAAFLPDRRTVVSVPPGNAIILWDARTGRLLREISTGRFTPGHVGFGLSRDGKRLVLSGSVSDDVRPGWRSAAAVFDLEAGKLLRTFEREPREGVNAAAITPDGKLVFTLDGNGKLRVEEVATGAELLRQQFPRDVMASVAVSPDGSTLALASGPNTHKLFVWKWQAGEEPRPVESGWHRGREVVFSPDGKLLAECSDAEPGVRVLDVATGRLRRKLEVPGLEPYRHYHLAFSPDGKLLAAYGGTNDRDAVHLWGPATGKYVRRLDVGGALAFSPDGKLLVAGSQVWDFAAGKELSANPEAHRTAVQRILTGPQDMVVTAGDDDTIRVWDATTGKQRLRIALDGQGGMSIRALALSPDGKRLVSSSMRDDSVYLWDAGTGKRIYRLAGHGRLGSVAAAAVFAPDGKSFRTWGAADMCLRQWDVRTGKAVAEHALRPTGLALPSEDDEPAARERRMLFIGGGSFTADGRRLVFQANSRFFVFDAATGKEVRFFPGEGNFGVGMAVSPDGKLVLATAYGKSVVTKLPDGSIQSSAPKSHPVTTWDLATGGLHKQVSLPEEGPGPVAFAPDGKLFAVASSRPGTLIRLMETATGREVHKVEGFRGTVRSLAFLPDGKRLVSGMGDGSALVWDLARVADRRKP
jgi:WD40 repeat protein